MARKPAEHILELELPSRIYWVILCKKDQGITGYSIAKQIYQKKLRYYYTIQEISKFPTPIKVYQVLKRLKKEGLTEEVETTIKGRRAKIIKPNLIKFFEVLNERRLPPDFRLTKGEIKTLAKWFEEFDLNFYVPEEAGEMASSLGLSKISVLDVVAGIFKLGVYQAEFLQEKKVKPDDLIKAFKKFLPLIAESARHYKPFFELPPSILEKFKHLQLSDPVEGILKYAVTFGKALFYYVSGKKA